MAMQCTIGCIQGDKVCFMEHWKIGHVGSHLDFLKEITGMIPVYGMGLLSSGHQWSC